MGYCLSEEESSQKASKKEKLRIDFIIEEAQVLDEEKGHFRFLLVPDPSVWERREVNGVKGYLNKMDNTFLSDSVLADSAAQLEGIPIKYRPADSIRKDEYLEKSKRRLAQNADESK